MDKTKNILLVLGFVVLAAFGVSGWLHHPDPASAMPGQPASNVLPPQQAPMADVAPQGQPDAAGGYPPNASQYNQEPQYNQPQYNQPQYNQPQYSDYPPAGNVAQNPAPAYRTEAAAAPSRTTQTTYRRPRSTKKSVAIVAGSAGVGAAIGALAGGGRGAGIGALAAGAGGFLYDRMTANK